MIRVTSGPNEHGTEYIKGWEGKWDKDGDEIRGGVEEVKANDRTLSS